MAIPPSDDALIAQYVERDPAQPWPGGERIKDLHTPVWALIGYYKLGAHGDIDLVADDYEVPRDAVAAALAFYNSNEHAHRAIDAHIDANERAGE
jgi:uncharacterized protein (DUF433 family)